MYVHTYVCVCMSEYVCMCQVCICNYCHVNTYHLTHWADLVLFVINNIVV